jgi:hypothetical protein
LLAGRGEDVEARRGLVAVEAAVLEVEGAEQHDLGTRPTEEGIAVGGHEPLLLSVQLRLG